MFQLDDSKSLHRKWLEITQHPFINGLFGVPGSRVFFSFPRQTWSPSRSTISRGTRTLEGNQRSVDRFNVGKGFFSHGFLCFFFRFAGGEFGWFLWNSPWICLDWWFFWRILSWDSSPWISPPPFGRMCFLNFFPKHRFESQIPVPGETLRFRRKKTWAMLDGDDHFWTLRGGSQRFEQMSNKLGGVEQHKDILQRSVFSWNCWRINVLSRKISLKVVKVLCGWFFV